MARSGMLGWGRRRTVRAVPATADHGGRPIAEAPRRGRVRIAGTVADVAATERGGTAVLEVTVDDGTGRAVARFTGRTEIPGITVGRSLLLEGMGRDEGTGLVLRNPSYRLLD